MKQTAQEREQEQNWIERTNAENQLAEILDTNKTAAAFGLALTREQAALIVAARKNALRQERRVEFGASVTKALIQTFCSSPYIGQDNFADMVIRLQEIFYEFKGEMLDQLTDDELLNFMREQFDGICAGDPDYLEDTVLAGFAQAVRGGYDGYKAADGRGEYSRFDDVKRWDPALYQEVLRNLTWE